jgi:UrcA family protein
MYRSLSAAAVALFALMSVPAVAQSITVTASEPSLMGFYEVKSVPVSLDGLDLNSAVGAATVLDRIDAAARLVCGERADRTINARLAKLVATCEARAVHYAVKELDAPALTQLASAR